MSNLPGNPHAYNAEYGMTSTVLSSDDSGTQTIEALLMDNARATLALAFEQRTANLIALWASPGNLPDGSYDKGMEMSGVNYGDLANQIKTRLGLGEP